MNDLKYYRTQVENKERILECLKRDLEEEHSEIVIMVLKEQIKTQEGVISYHEKTIEEIQSKSPHKYNIQCQLCADFFVCQVEENAYLPNNCQRGFTLIELHKNCHFRSGWKCMFGAKKDPKGNLISTGACTPGTCALKKTPEYEQWRKI